MDDASYKHNARKNVAHPMTDGKSKTNPRGGEQSSADGLPQVGIDSQCGEGRTRRKLSGACQNCNSTGLKRPCLSVFETGALARYYSCHYSESPRVFDWCRRSLK